MEHGVKIKLATAMGLAPSSIGRFLAGSARPKLATAKRLDRLISGYGPLFWMDATPEELQAAVDAWGKTQAQSTP